jgi:hypothetical protein
MSYANLSLVGRVVLYAVMGRYTLAFVVRLEKNFVSFDLELNYPRETVFEISVARQPILMRFDACDAKFDLGQDDSQNGSWFPSRI